MKRFTTLIVLAAATMVHADEIVLKDGKTVVWTALRDLGDSYEVETSDGVKLEIRKDQVARFVPKTIARVQKDKAVEVLTGATFTWDKGRKLQQFDLLKSVDIKTDAVTGDWKWAGGALMGTCKDTFYSPTRGGWARVETSYVPPEEYDLTLALERAEGSDGFFVGLVGLGKHQMSFGFDKDGWTGAPNIGGKGSDTNGCAVKERPFLKVGQKRTVVFMVRKFGLAVKLDGKDYIAWRGDWSEVRTTEMARAAKTNTIFFTNSADPFKIHQAVVTFPKE